MSEILEEQIAEIESFLIDIDVVLQDPDYIEGAAQAIAKIDEKIKEVIPHISAETPKLLINRLQTCAYTLQKQSEKAQSQLNDVKGEILKLKAAQKTSAAYKDL